MDISSYEIQENLWIDFLDKTFSNINLPIIGNEFEDVSNLFSKYFKKNNKDNKHIKHIKQKCSRKPKISNTNLFNKIKQKEYRLKKNINFYKH